MLTFNASAFFSATLDIYAFEMIVERVLAEHIDGLKIAAVGKLEQLEVSLHILDAEMTLLSLEKLKNRIESWDERSSYDRSQISEGYRELKERLKDELSLRMLFVIEPTKARYFNPREPLFGDAVASRFPSAAFEIDEAAKCLALDRSTAAVFHLMRTLEIGIQAISKALSIPDPAKPSNRNWGTILKKLKDEIDSRNSMTSWASHSERSFFENAYALLDAVRNVWRNSTTHVETKYVADEGEDIFAAVRGFMRTLASRIDETGKTSP